MIRIFKQYLPISKILFITGEGLLIFSSVLLSAYFLMDMEFTPLEIAEMNGVEILVITLATLLSLYFSDMYAMHKGIGRMEMTARLVQAIGLSCLVLAGIYFFQPGIMIARGVFILSTAFMFFFLLCWRMLYLFLSRKRFFAEKAVLIGDGKLARDIVSELNENDDSPYHIVSAFGTNGHRNDAPFWQNIPFECGFQDLIRCVTSNQASTIIVALDEKRGVMPYDQLLTCKMNGTAIVDGESFYERISGKLQVEKINPSSLIFSDGFVKSRKTRIVNRIYGLTLSTFLLVLFFPLMLVIALAIKLDSKGPVLFSQDRVGENGKVFTIYKFRSMIVDAEKMSGPVWAGEDDPRITRVGKMIRKLRFDELPQLWNVFTGDMSFVGPRPGAPLFRRRVEKDHSLLRGAVYRKARCHRLGADQAPLRGDRKGCARRAQVRSVLNQEHDLCHGPYGHFPRSKRCCLAAAPGESMKLDRINPGEMINYFTGQAGLPG